MNLDDFPFSELIEAAKDNEDLVYKILSFIRKGKRNKEYRKEFEVVNRIIDIYKELGCTINVIICMFSDCYVIYAKKKDGLTEFKVNEFVACKYDTSFIRII